MSRYGVNVEIYAAGDGINYPKAGHTVSVHYTGNLPLPFCRLYTVLYNYNRFQIGYLPDGKRFDSSRERGKPFRFKLGAEQVIPGLDSGIAQLSVGERAKMTIPASLAYGDRGFPGLIPARTDLIFDIELLSYS